MKGVRDINVYTLFLMIGIGIPLLSLLLAPFSWFFDGDFDFHLDCCFNITAWLPLSPLTMSAFLIGCGGTGLLLYDITSLHYVFAIIVGMLFFLFFKRVVLDNLKKVKTYSVTSKDYIGKQGKIVHKVDKDIIGVVSVKNENGIITYLAKSDELIEQDSIVELVELTTINQAECFIVKKIH